MNIILLFFYLAGIVTGALLLLAFLRASASGNLHIVVSNDKQPYWYVVCSKSLGKISNKKYVLFKVKTHKQ